MLHLPDGLEGRMNQDQFLLKWNNHQNNFVEVFNYLRTQDAFVDVTLACDGKSFSAHKVVLSACSPYFQTLFQTNPCKHPIVFLKDVKGQELEALIEFIYKGEVSVSQSELASLISTAENLKIKGLAEPERPCDKTLKRLGSPQRLPNPTLTLPAQSTPNTPVAVAVGVAQHLQVSKYPSSPAAKRRKSEFNVQSAYVTVRESNEDLVAVDAGSGENLSLRGENLSLRGENLGIREHPQVVLVPTHNPEVHQGDNIATHTPQAYTSHHCPIVSSEGVLYSVSGAAVYAGTAQVSSSSRVVDQVATTRDVYPQTETYQSSDEGTLPGPSGVQTQTHAADASMTIKLEPSAAGISAEAWEGSNQSYDDGGGSSSGGGGVVVSAGDSIGMPLPLHADIAESSELHDSSRSVGRRSAGVKGEDTRRRTLTETRSATNTHRCNASMPSSHCLTNNEQIQSHGSAASDVIYVNTPQPSVSDPPTHSVRPQVNISDPPTHSVRPQAVVSDPQTYSVRPQAVVSDLQTHSVRPQISPDDLTQSVTTNYSQRNNRRSSSEGLRPQSDLTVSPQNRPTHVTSDQLGQTRPQIIAPDLGHINRPQTDQQTRPNRPQAITDQAQSNSNTSDLLRPQTNRSAAPNVDALTNANTPQTDPLDRSQAEGSDGAGTEGGRRKWKFACMYCVKSFPTRWGLDRHTRTHTGEKPYTCHICHRNFNEQSNYQRHFRRHFMDK